MASIKLEELKHDIAELNKLLAHAERQRVKGMLLVEIRKLETEMSTIQEQLEKQNYSEPMQVAPPSNKPKCYEVKLNNYAWDQNDKHVKIFVTLKNVHTLAEGNVFCEFTNRSVELHVKGLDNRNYQLPIKNLLEEIDTSKSYWKVKTDNIIIFLAKKNAGKNWSHMTGSEKKAQDAKVPKMEPGDDPSAGLMDLMKKMYDEGDDEMKRTIAKAWTESREKQMAGEPMGF